MLMAANQNTLLQRRLGLRCPAASPAAWAPWPAVTAPRLVGVLASAAAWHVGSGVGLGVGLCAGHQACAVHLAWLRCRERAVSHISSTACVGRGQGLPLGLGFYLAAVLTIRGLPGRCRGAQRIAASGSIIHKRIFHASAKEYLIFKDAKKPPNGGLSCSFFVIQR